MPVKVDPINRAPATLNQLSAAAVRSVVFVLGVIPALEALLLPEA